MSKYYDELVQISESLDKGIRIMNESAISNTNFEHILQNASSDISKSDAIVMAFWNNAHTDPRFMKKSMDDVTLAEFAEWLVEPPNDVMFEEGDEDKIEIPKDSLTDDQKKDILIDSGVDKSTVDGMKDSSQLDSALDATLNNDSIKNESHIDSSFIIRMDDDDLDMHGYVEVKDNVEKLHLTEELGGAAKYGSEEIAQEEIKNLCERFHYDPSTFNIESLNEQYGGLDDVDGWVSIDSSDVEVSVAH